MSHDVNCQQALIKVVKLDILHVIANVTAEPVLGKSNWMLHIKLDMMKSCSEID